MLVTTAAIYKRKIAKIRDQLPVGQTRPDRRRPGHRRHHNFHALMEQADDDAPIEPTTAEDPSLLHFTSGTTGTPKGAQHVHGAVAMHHHRVVRPGPSPRRHLLVHRRSRLGHRNLLRDHRAAAARGHLDHRRGGVRRPALVSDPAGRGRHRLVHRPDGDPDADQGRTGTGGGYRFPHLRFIASVGEPLNAEAVWWGKRVLGLLIHDNWWQTETGGIMVANTPAFDIKPGSMGRPLPGGRGRGRTPRRRRPRRPGHGDRRARRRG